MRIEFWRTGVWLVLAACCMKYSLLAQTPNELKRYLDLVEKGQLDSVRPYLPSLVAKYQNEPAVLYLQARVTTNGIEAVKLYQSIVTNFPQSEWADDALYRVYQYYYAMGLYKTAEQKLNLLKKNYPNSPYLAGSIEMKFPQVDETKPKLAEELPDSIVPIAKYEEENVDTVRQTRAAPQVETKSVKSQGKYTLQVGAFSTSANAEKQKLLLDSYGQPIEIKSSVRNGRTLYLVHVGSFQTPEEARSVAKDIQLKYNVQSMVVEK